MNRSDGSARENLLSSPQPKQKTNKQIKYDDNYTAYSKTMTIITTIGIVIFSNENKSNFHKNELGRILEQNNRISSACT